MRDMKDTCRIAVVQATPVMFDKDGCLEKALRLIDESADHGAELVVFPGLFIPGYRYGMTFGFLCISPPTPTTPRSGRTPSATSPSRDTATSSTPI